MLRTITAIERDGFDVRVLVLNFEVPDEKFDLMAAVKAAALEYCQTEDGKKTFLDYNRGYFNWADFEMYVPNEICERHGFSVLRSPVADLVVDWDEQLVEREEMKEAQASVGQVISEAMARSGEPVQKKDVNKVLD